MSPDVFWKLTPYEALLFIEGRGKRLRQTQELLAWHVCHIINLHRKKGKAAMTPRRLLGNTRDQLRPEDYSSVDEFREAVAQRRAEREEERADGD